jgi:DNA-binding FrmR family transcriptional regulator
MRPTGLERETDAGGTLDLVEPRTGQVHQQAKRGNSHDEVALCIPGASRAVISAILYPCTLFAATPTPMAHTIKEKSALLARVRRIQGQCLALERALEQDSECAAVLQQIAAIRGAVNGLMMQVLEGHLREHLVAEDRTPEERREDLEQLVAVLRSYLK